MRVKATREGLLGHTTASGYIIDNIVPFVALPCRAVLYRAVRVFNPLTNIHCDAVVLDVGPWNTADDDYVLRGERPQAETGIDTQGRETNKAGIDLGHYVWNYLQMQDNTDVEWCFLDGPI
jgi:hypothetical protein